MRNGELLFRAAAFLFFTALVPPAWQLGWSRRYGEVGSGFWPLLILGSATALSIFLLLQELWGELRRRPPSAGERTAGDPRRFLLAAGITLVYLLVLPYFGFVLSTPIFLVVFTLGLGERRIGWVGGAPILITLFFFLFFIKFASIPLPRGSGIFLHFSRLLY